MIFYSSCCTYDRETKGLELLDAGTVKFAVEKIWALRNRVVRYAAEGDKLEAKEILRPYFLQAEG